MSSTVSFLCKVVNKYMESCMDELPRFIKSVFNIRMPRISIFRYHSLYPWNSQKCLTNIFLLFSKVVSKPTIQSKGLAEANRKQ